MRRWASLIGSVLLWLPLFAPPAGAAPVGEYDVSGKNAAGDGPYQGTVIVTPNGDTYGVVWSIGADVYHGTGIDNGVSFAVVYESGGRPGLAVYVMTIDGIWEGLWANHGDTATGFERWTPR